MELSHHLFQRIYGGQIASAPKALYRALQDQKAAIRYLVHFADAIINIDTNYIYVAGGSAGAVSSLGLQYFPQDFFDTEFSDLGLYDTLGPLDSSTNGLTESFSLAGIISMWGAVPDTSVITAANNLPTLMIHCTGDTLVPCISSTFFSCPNYISAQGSCVISERLKELNQCYEFNYYSATPPYNGCHNVYNKDYHIERISKFLKRLFCDDCRQITIENQVEIANDPVIPTGTSNPSLSEKEINIYPNPTSAELRITSNAGIGKITIYNLLGEKLKSYFIWNYSADLILDSLKAGAYILRIELFGNEVVMKKIIIE